MDKIAYFFILLSGVLAAVIIILTKRKVVVYNKKTNELIASIGITTQCINILSQDVSFILVDDIDKELYLIDKETGKVCLVKDDK